jgi:signal transduction histidine kinase
MWRSERPLYLLAVSVMAIIAAVAWIGGSTLQTATRTQVGDKVVTILDISHRALEAWTGGHRQAVGLWGDSPAVASLTQALLETDLTQSALLSSPAQTDMRVLLAAVLTSRDYQGYFVVGRDGLSLSSTRDENVGAPNLALAQSGFFERIWEGETAMSTPMNSDVPLPDENGVFHVDQATMFVGAPIRDADGEIVAALTLRIDPTQDFTAILQRGRVGESGETYAFDEEGRLISESRFDDQLRSIGLIDSTQRAILNVGIRDPGVNLVAGEDGALPVDERPLTRMASAALGSGGGRDLDGYRDYRGIEVVGAWLWDEDLNLGIASEVDVDEAYSVLRSNRIAMIGVTVFVELLILGVAIVVVRHRRGLVELVNSKDELIASISHEIRTPLTAMVGFSQLLKDEAFDLSPTDRRDMIRSIADEGVDLTNIVEDLLTAAKTEAGTLAVVAVPVSLRAQAAQVLETFGQKAREHIEVDGPPVGAIGDPARIRQILRNLISNALRYGGDRVRVTVIGADSTARVLVTDNGPGVPREEHERIFEPYHRAHDKPGLTASIGLGLSISRKLARLMDGDLVYRRETGVTIFELLLPKATEMPELASHGNTAYRPVASHH